MKLKALFLVFVFCLFSLSLSGKEKTVRVTTLTDFAPNCFPLPGAKILLEETISPGSDSSQLQGYSWDIVRESFHAMGYTIQLWVAPWSRGMLYIDKGKVDLIFPTTKTLERQKRFYYSKEIVDETKVVIYLPKDSSFRYQGLESLNGLKIGTVREWGYGKVWEAADSVIKVPSSTILQGFSMLDKGRVFGVVGYEDSFDYRLKKEKIFHKYQKTPSLEHIADYIVGLKTETVKQYVNDYDAGFRKIKNNGILAQLRAKWADLIIVSE